MTNGLVQHIIVEESTSIQWVNQFMPSGFFYPCKLDESIHHYRVSGLSTFNLSE